MGGVYTVHLVKNGTTVLGGVKRAQIGRSLNALVQGASGGIESTHAGAAGQEPTVTVETVHIAEWWTALGLGAAVDAAGATVGFQKLGGVARAGSSAHVLATIYAGFFSLSEIGGSHGQDAKSTYELHAVDDGTNGAIGVVSNASLTGDQEVTEKYVIGPAKINNVMTETASWRFRPGHGIYKKSNSGKINPQYAGINRRAPEISITSDDVGAFGVAPAAITSLTLFLLKFGETGPASLASEVHISLTFTSGVVWGESAEASDASEGTTTIEARPVWDGSNAVVQVNLAAAVA